MRESEPAGWGPPEGPEGPPPWGGGAAGRGPVLQPGTVLPTYSAPTPRRRGRALVGVAVGVVAAVAAGAFALVTPAADTASSPEAAVEAMFAALEDRDVLGVLDTLAPAERELYQPFIEDMVGELQRLEILSGDLDLGSVGGVAIDIEGLTLASRPLTDGLSVVTVTGGTITSTVTPAEVPLGSFVRGVMDDPEGGLDLEPVTSTEDLAAEEVAIAVVDDGGWHVSLHYTLAELLRQEAGAPLPDFASAVQPAGAASPEAAVEELVHAAVDLDLRRVIALLPPGELSALHDYAPLFLDDAEAAVAELQAEAGYEVSIDRLDTAAERDGDTAKVTVGGFAVSGVVDGEAFDVDYDGRCVSGTLGGDREEVCTDDLREDGGTSFAELVDADLGVVTVERDGAWYVSPTRSMFEVVLAVVRAVDREDLEDPEAFLGEAFGFNPFVFGLAPGMATGTGGEEWVTTEPADDPYASCSAPYDELPADATDEQWQEADRAYDACVSGVDGDTAATTVPTGGAATGDCFAAYDELSPDATEEELEAADAAFALCAARSGEKTDGG